MFFTSTRQEIRNLPLKKEDRTKDTLALLNQWDRLSEENGVMYHTIQDPSCGQRRQLVLPQAIKEEILTSLHDDMGHQVLKRTSGLYTSLEITVIGRE